MLATYKKIFVLLIFFVGAVFMTGCDDENGSQGGRIGDSTLRRYTVSFEPNSLQRVEEITAFENQRIPHSGSFIEPFKEGYVFLGWFDNPEFQGEPVEYIVKLNSNITLYALWEPVED